MAPSYQMRVTIRGVTYENVQLAAEALGVKKSTVRVAAFNDRLDYVGLGSGNHSNHGIARSKPFKMGGKTYRSMAEASRALGMCDDYIRSLVRQGRLENLTKRLMMLQAKNERAAREELDKRMSHGIDVKSINRGTKRLNNGEHHVDTSDRTS